jgi:hypothetical protein
MHVTNAEHRILLQTPDDLRRALTQWADEWNKAHQ